MTCLLCAICFEGLARKFLSGPEALFYFLKDIVLLWGLVLYGIRRSVLRSASWAYGGFVLALAMSMGWTIMQSFNPDQQSMVLAVIGLRAYWLWWIAPLVIASAIRHREERDRVIAVLSLICLVVAAFAFLQFGRPADDPLNTYAWIEDGEIHTAQAVHSTQRARVSSTFSYISGFTSFVTLAPGLLLALALSQNKPRIRLLGFAAVLATIVAAPMSGSRAPIVLAGLFLLIVLLTSGVVRSRTGRRALLVAAIALPLVSVAAPVALQGSERSFRRRGHREPHHGRPDALAARGDHGLGVPPDGHRHRHGAERPPCTERSPPSSHRVPGGADPHRARGHRLPPLLDGAPRARARAASVRA
jgi:hypothetical protein